MNETLKTISNRKSTRSYKTEQISDMELNEILDAAIAAESLNIGSCWIGTFLPLFASENGEEYKNVLGIPEGYNLICSVALGYKAVEHAAVPSRNKDTINFIKER